MLNKINQQEGKMQMNEQIAESNQFKKKVVEKLKKLPNISAHEIRQQLRTVKNPFFLNLQKKIVEIYLNLVTTHPEYTANYTIKQLIKASESVNKPPATTQNNILQKIEKPKPHSDVIAPIV